MATDQSDLDLRVAGIPGANRVTSICALPGYQTSIRGTGPVRLLAVDGVGGVERLPEFELVLAVFSATTICLAPTRAS